MMNNKIGLEEHFALEGTLGDSRNFVGADIWTDLCARLLDVQDIRLREMDANGIELMILSLNCPAIQAITDTPMAVETAQRTNDFLAAQIAQNPRRFRGFAALPMQDPDLAARELERCVKDLGFVGALVNGYSQVNSTANAVYYDGKPYWDFWSTVESLGVPFYLHPREPSERKAYEGHPWLVGPAYGFGAETALHALRLIGSGLFDRFEKLNIILGHLGEALPFMLFRIDERIEWSPMGYPAKRKVSEYFRRNFLITTAGNCRTQPFLSSLLEVGASRILFSTDYPFEEIERASQWFDGLPISEDDRQLVGRENATKLFNLSN